MIIRTSLIGIVANVLLAAFKAVIGFASSSIAIGIYSVNTRDPEAVELRNRIRDTAMSCEYVLQVHGFYLDKETKTIRFDLVISFDAPDRYDLFLKARDAVQEACPGYTVLATMDSDFTGERL